MKNYIYIYIYIYIYVCVCVFKKMIAGMHMENSQKVHILFAFHFHTVLTWDLERRSITCPVGIEKS